MREQPYQGDRRTMTGRLIPCTSRTNTYLARLELRLPFQYAEFRFKAMSDVIGTDVRNLTKEDVAQS
jgi:hypothetical protein